MDCAHNVPVMTCIQLLVVNISKLVHYVFVFAIAADRSTLQLQLSRQLELTRMVTQCMESILSQSNEWAPVIWDSVLQFCLVICHYILAFPLPTPNQRLLPGAVLPTVNTGAGSTGAMTNAAISTPIGNTGSIVNSAGALGGPVGSGSASSNATNSVIGDGGGAGEDRTVADLAESISESVFGLLMNTWLKACAHCFPRPQMWVALKECVKVWRHQTAVVSIWSNCVIALTNQLLLILYKTSGNKTADLNSSSCEFSSACAISLWILSRNQFNGYANFHPYWHSMDYKNSYEPIV